MAVKQKPATQRPIPPMSKGERLSILEDMIKHPERYLPKSIRDISDLNERNAAYSIWRNQTQLAYKTIEYS